MTDTLPGRAADRSSSSTRFRYRAARQDGGIARGTLSAPDLEAAKQRLENDGLAVLDIGPGFSWSQFRPVRRQDLAVVFRNVALLVADGVPIERALAASESLVKGRLREALRQSRVAIREGCTVAQAMETTPEVFPRHAVGIMRAGERTSRIEAACETVADQLEEEVRLRSEIRSALSYPLLILGVGVASVIVMGAVVVPRFAEVLSGLNAELPGATRALLGASIFLRSFGVVMGAGFITGAVVAMRLARSPVVRRKIDALLLNVPVIGRLRMGFSSARVCRALGGMLNTGMPLLSALDAAAQATGDHEVSRRLERVRESVARGRRLTESLTEERVFTPLALQLVGVGESSGRLGPMLARAGNLVAARTQRSLRSLVSLVEPVLIIVLGAFVAGIAAALLQAVYSVRP